MGRESIAPRNVLQKANSDIVTVLEGKCDDCK